MSNGARLAVLAGLRADRWLLFIKQSKPPTNLSLLNSVQILITDIHTLILSGLIKLRLLIGSQKD